MSSRNIGIAIVLVCCVTVAYLVGRNAALNEELQQKQRGLPRPWLYFLPQSERVQPRAFLH